MQEAGATGRPDQESAQLVAAAGISAKGRIALVVGLFLLGLLAGWSTRTGGQNVDSALSTSLQEHHEVEEPGVLSKTNALAEDPPAEKVTLTAGDQHFRDERYARALAIYRQLEVADRKESVALNFRLALCEEETESFELALKRYQQIVHAGNFAQAQAAHLSQARVHLRQGKPAEAQALLWPFVLRGGHGGDPDVLAEAAYMLALAFGMECVVQEIAKSSTRDFSFPHQLPWRTHRYLDETVVRVQKINPPTRLVLAPAERKCDQMILEGGLAKGPSKDILEQLAKSAGITLEWSPKSLAAIEGRSASFFSANLSILSVFHGFADAMDLICEAQAEKVRFVHRSEQDPKVRQSNRMTLARRMLAETVGHNPKHAFAPAACLMLGNLDAATAPASALEWYNRIGAAYPTAKENLHAQFNKAVLSERLGDASNAKRSFFSVLDQAPGHPLANLALFRLGFASLEEADFPRALAYLKRADANMVDPHDRANLLLSLAMAYTLTDNPDQVKACLSKQRELLSTDSQRAYASLLVAYAQFRDSAEDAAAVAGQELLLALLSLPEEIPLGSFGQYIVGLAYADLGIWDRVIDIHLKLARTEKGVLLHEVQLRLGDGHSAKGNRKEARAFYEAASRSRSTARTWAMYRLAVLELEDNRPAACIQWCRQLLDEPNPVGVSRVLVTMGRAYERLGDLDKATRCFGGEIPS